jgi:ketosteroid isomerase-like protein
MCLRQPWIQTLLLLLVLPLAHAQKASVTPADQIGQLRADWCKFLHDKQLDPEMALYAEDAVFIQPAAERVAGLPAIRKLFVQVMGMVTSDPILTSINLEFSGDLAYDSGEYSETLTNVGTGAKSQARGSYLMVLKHQPDGKWRIQQQMWSQYP